VISTICLASRRGIIGPDRVRSIGHALRIVLDR